MFSVIIPYFNKAAYIIRCIDSVLNQTVGDYEIIVINDGSTDNGVKLISDKYKDSIAIYSQKNQGVSVARNNGIKQAKFDYIALLDADDCWHPQYLESMLWILQHEKEVKIIGAHYSRKNNFFQRKYYTLPYFKFGDYFKDAIRNTYFTSSSSVIEKKFFEENNGFNTILQKGEDIDVWFRIIKSGGNAFYINHTLVYYSDEDANQITKNRIGLDKDLVGNIYKMYTEPKMSGNTSFDKLISLYVYFNLYPYYFDNKNNAKAKLVLKEIRHSFPLLKLAYRIPFSVGKRMVDSQRGSRLIRLYLKFTIRYIYN